MNKTSSLKNLYGIDYDESNYQSSLIKWYNRVLNKSVDELTVTDVSRMIRQNILRNVAIDRAIELFINEPFVGEMQDGDLLALLVSCSPEVVDNKLNQALITAILKAENEISNFDWTNEDRKAVFERNITTFKKILGLLSTT